MKMKKTIYLSACILWASLLGAIPANEEAEKAPPFELISLGGTIYTEQDLIGHPTLLIFWNSWCELCPTELPKAYALQEKLKGTKFQILAIGIADTEANIQDYVTSHLTHFNFPVLYDGGDWVAARYGVNKVPIFFLLNKKGELELAYQGEGLFEHPQFHLTLSDLLDQRRI